VSVVLAFVSGLFGAGVRIGQIETKLVAVEQAIPQKLAAIETKIDGAVKAQETSERHMREMMELLREKR
jgi:hypothetical protein